MLEELEDAIILQTTNMNGNSNVTRIEHNPIQMYYFDDVRILLPRRSISGKWLQPFTAVARYTHYITVYTVKNVDGKNIRSMFSKWYYVYMTHEEYVILKLTLCNSNKYQI